jgi:hypothetical protein
LGKGLDQGHRNGGDFQLSHLILLLAFVVPDVQGLDDPRLYKPIIIIEEEPIYYLSPPYRDEKFQRYV